MTSFRYLCSLAIGLTVVCLASAFAPAPIYKAPPKPNKGNLRAALQGEWQATTSSVLIGAGANRIKGKVKSTSPVRRVLIENDTWSFVSMVGGAARPSTLSYRITLDTKQEPVRMQLHYPDAERSIMRGIVKIEADRVTFCYVTSVAAQKGDEPANFTDTTTPSGNRVIKLVLTRIP